MSPTERISFSQSNKIIDAAIRDGCEPDASEADSGKKVMNLSLGNEPLRICYETGIKAGDKVYTLDEITLECSYNHIKEFRKQGIIKDFSKSQSIEQSSASA